MRPFLVEGQAQEVFETLPQLRSFQPFNLTAILQAKGGLEWRLKDVLAARMSDTHSVWMPTLKVIPRQAKTSLGPSTTVTLSGVALFRRDYLQVVLDPWAYQVMVWFLGNPTGFTITAHCPNGEYGTLSARVVTGKLRVRPYWQGDRPAFRVEATSRVNVTRSACRTGAVEDADVRDQLEQALSDDLRQRIEHFIEIMQTRVADPVGFGKHAAAGLSPVLQEDGGQVGRGGVDRHACGGGGAGHDHAGGACDGSGAPDRKGAAGGQTVTDGAALPSRLWYNSDGR